MQNENRKFLTLKVSGFGYMGKTRPSENGKYMDLSLSSSYGTDETNWTRVRIVGSELVEWFEARVEETGYNYVFIDGAGLETPPATKLEDGTYRNYEARLIVYSRAQIRLLPTEKALLRRHGVVEEKVAAKPAAKAPAKPAAKPAVKPAVKPAAKRPAKPTTAIAGDWD
jgi:hypothetical protein